MSKSVSRKMCPETFCESPCLWIKQHHSPCSLSLPLSHSLSPFLSVSLPPSLYLSIFSPSLPLSLPLSLSPVEAVHLGSLIAAHGYFFPISDHVLTLKDDGTFYRFQVRLTGPVGSSMTH